MSDRTVLALSGSLRQGSFNTQLIEAARELAPDGLRIERYDYRDVPLYDADLGTPEPVEALKRAIAGADAVLLATPEYNYSVSGVLKNALDWASRPAFQSPFRDKPVGVISASASFVGGARAQQHAKTILLAMGAQVFPWPELLIGGAGGKFADGRLTDEASRRFLGEFLVGLSAWVDRVG